MKKERSESVPPSNNSRKNHELSFGKNKGRQHQQESPESMQVDDGQLESETPSPRKPKGRKRDLEAERRREEKRLRKQQMARVQSGKKYNPWTEEEHKLFVAAAREHGRNWYQISLHVGTRTRDQC